MRKRNNKKSANVSSNPRAKRTKTNKENVDDEIVDLTQNQEVATTEQQARVVEQSSDDSASINFGDIANRLIARYKDCEFYFVCFCSNHYFI
jgi:hypothetical protein